MLWVVVVVVVDDDVVVVVVVVVVGVVDVAGVTIVVCWCRCCWC